MIASVNEMIWGYPALILILTVGLFISVCHKFPQLRLFRRALRQFIQQFQIRSTDASSGYNALCTALAATVGTGNMIGVACAIATGGPGAIFWMWVCGFLGMGIKFAEATLAVRYRVKNKYGEYVGGPMYIIENGIGKSWKWLAAIYAMFGVIASFGVGNAVQVNAVVLGVRRLSERIGIASGNYITWIVGIGLAVLVGSVLVGGANRIRHVAQITVPVVACGYMLLCVVVLVVRFAEIPSAINLIFRGAFSPHAVTGGVLGSAFSAIRIGAAKGTFTNEAGMGTASIAHAGANVTDPIDQGLMGIMEVFIDTIVICTMTALAILCSGVKIPYGVEGTTWLLFETFTTVTGQWIEIPLALALCCFAIATIFGWSLYGIRCVEYLFGVKAWKFFAYAQSSMVVIGAVVSTVTAWSLSELLNGLMLIPNLVALIWLNPELSRLIKKTGM